VAGMSTTEKPANDKSNVSISDQRFMAQLYELEKLKRFLFEEKVKFQPEQIDSIDLGPLNSMRFRTSGRSPTTDEWKLLDEKLISLVSYLDVDLRRKFRMRELNYFFGIIPLGFLVTAVMVTIGYTTFAFIFPVPSSFGRYASFVTLVILWAITLGGLGACAALAVQAMAVKKSSSSESSGDDQFNGDIIDVTDRNMLQIRIIIGCLFAFIIGLPLAIKSLDTLYNALINPKTDTPPQASDIAFIILPFILGFSTSLVLAILKRCVIAIQAFFGIPSSQEKVGK
jgi:hypothetical protein